MKPFDVGVATDRGMTRATNQDAYAFFLGAGFDCHKPVDFGCFVVADGMGGHVSGQQVALITVRTFISEITQKLYMPLNNGAFDETVLDDVMASSFQEANSRILVACNDAGSVATGVVIVGDQANIVHVGDTRCYLVSGDMIEQLTKDHTLLMRLVTCGSMLPGVEPEETPEREVLYRALGQSETLDVDAPVTGQLLHGDSLVLCSDGLWKLCNNDEIKQIVKGYPPQQACDELIALAKARGGEDDMTIMVIRYHAS